MNAFPPAVRAVSQLLHRPALGGVVEVAVVAEGAVEGAREVVQRRDEEGRRAAGGVTHLQSKDDLRRLGNERSIVMGVVTEGL